MTNLPPYSEEAERAVLGSILIEPDRVRSLCAERHVTADFFYLPAHRLLFEFLSGMDTAIDLVTVGKTLKEAGRLDQAGGYAFLEGLIDSTPTSAHSEYYLEIIEELHRKRQIITLAEDAIDRCHVGGESTSQEIASSLSQAVVSAVDVSKPSDKADLVGSSLTLFDNAHRGIVSGVPLPWAEFSRKVGGIQKRCVCPLLGRDGSGKSMLISKILLSLGAQGIPALSFPMEDGADRQMRRMAACWGKYSNTELENGVVKNGDRWESLDEYAYQQRREAAEHALREVAGMSVFFEDGYYTAEQIRALCANYKRKRDIQIVFVDGIKDVVPTKGENSTKQEEHISRVLVQTAKDLDIAIVPVCHLTDVPDGVLITRRNLRGAKTQFHNARQILIFQDQGIETDNYLIDANTIGLHMEKNNYGRAAMLYLNTDFEFCDFKEASRYG
jgi:replicative DNA helicase